jgi:hypothetical protein
MNRRLEEDLERWDAGLAPLAEIEERHPGQDVRGLTELHRRLATLTGEATPDPEGGWQRLSARLPERERDVILVGPSEPKRRHVLTRTRVAVLGLAAAFMLTGGLAAAGVLPGPAQDAVATVAGHLGLHFPHSADVPDQTSHGKEVSNIARSTPAEGCEKGQAVSEVASSFAQQNRRNGDHEPVPCDKSQGAGGHSGDGGSGSGQGVGPARGSTHVSGSGGDHRGSHGPPG